MLIYWFFNYQRALGTSNTKWDVSIFYQGTVPAGLPLKILLTGILSLMERNQRNHGSYICFVLFHTSIVSAVYLLLFTTAFEIHLRKI